MQNFKYSSVDETISQKDNAHKYMYKCIYINKFANGLSANGKQ